MKKLGESAQRGIAYVSRQRRLAPPPKTRKFDMARRSGSSNQPNSGSGNAANIDRAGSVRNRAMALSKLRPYPSVALLSSLPQPPRGAAIMTRGSRWELWHRARSAALRLAVGLALGLAGIGISGIGATAASCVIGVGAASVASAIPRLVRIEQCRRLLRTHEWSTYNVMDRLLTGDAGMFSVALQPAGATEELEKPRIYLRFAGGVREEWLNQTQSQSQSPAQVWFAGDPLKHGVLCAAGGGKLFYTSSSRPWERKPGRRNQAVVWQPQAETTTERGPADKPEA